MSYPSPYGGQAPGVGYGYPQPGPSVGSGLGFENVPPYPGGAPCGYGPPAPGFGGYPPQQGAYPPSSGYPQPYGAAQPPQPGGYGQPPTGQPPLAYPHGTSNYGQPAPSGYPNPGGQPAPSGYPNPGGQPAPSGYPNPGGQPAPSGYPAPASQYPAPGGGQYGAPYGSAPSHQPQYGGNPAPPNTGHTLSYGHGGGGGYQAPASGGGSPFYGAPAPGYGSSSGGYGQQPAPGYGAGMAPAGGGYGGVQQGYTTGSYTPMPTMSYSSTHFQGTVKPSPSFNPNIDCESLKKAMKGIGCDDKAIINVLCYRSNAQRQQIRQMFKTMYGKDLIKELVSELRGNLEDVIVALMLSPAEFDARELNYAMSGAGTTESTLIEIMATRTNAEIRDIRMAYRTMFGKDLEHALTSETSGYFKRMLVSLCNAGRDESMHVDPARAKKSATDLFQAGVKRWGTDEATFNAVLCSQNYAQLQAVFEEYRKLAGNDIEQAVKTEFSGDIEDGLLAIVKSAKNAPAFFAERAYSAMVGMGTNDRKLIRIITTRCEKDMVQIKQEYQRIYGKSLDSAIAGDTSGKYKDAMIALVRGN